VQHVIYILLADNNHFKIERYRFGLESSRSHCPVQFIYILDHQAFGAHGPLERFIDERLTQDLFDVQDQVAAVGFKQGTGLDQGIIGIR